MQNLENEKIDFKRKKVGIIKINLQWIEKNFNEGVTLFDIAKTLTDKYNLLISPQYLSIAIKRIKGRGLSKLNETTKPTLNKLKVEKSEKLLDNSTLGTLKNNEELINYLSGKK